MPKRVVDGEAIYRSDKLSAVRPEWVRYHYPWLIPLALANGVFECEPRRVWSQAYSHMGDITVEQTQNILDALSEFGLLFRWKTPDEKLWGFWVGIEKPGRLPVASNRGKKAGERVGPNPPFSKLCEYKRLASLRTNSSAGFGFGLGLGFGLNPETPAANPAAAPFKPKRSRSPEEQKQNIEACNRRLEKEAYARKESRSGHNWMSDQIAELAKAKAM